MGISNILTRHFEFLGDIEHFLELFYGFLHFTSPYSIQYY